jgi:hypothetical protein
MADLKAVKVKSALPLRLRLRLWRLTTVERIGFVWMARSWNLRLWRQRLREAKAIREAVNRKMDEAFIYGNGGS